MTLRRLKLLSILVPLVFLVVLELLREVIFPDVLAGWPGYLLIGGIVLTGVLFFSEAVFTVINRARERLEQKNRELLALHEAGLDITADLEIDTVLQKVVDEARALIGAQYGAMSYLNQEGGIGAFLTAGITPEQREILGPPPVGHGLLGVTLRHGERLRLPDLGKDPRSVGFPPNHPPMRSLLAAPIISRGEILGNLYLTEKLGADAFTVGDEETLERLATQAALAIENARLHTQARALAVAEERDRIAREIHDSVAQVLGYVNTKTQAIEELLKAGNTERATVQIAQMGQVAREAYADAREHILGLRAAAVTDRPFTESLAEYLVRWQEASGVVATLEIDARDSATMDLRLSDVAELQLLRIIQEALANVRKHAEATRASVHLRECDSLIEVTVEDDGTGFDREAPGRSHSPRFGLSTMRERAEAVGGSLAIESAPGTGTRVIARIPQQRGVASSARTRETAASVGRNER